MFTDDSDLGKYDQYEEQFDPMKRDRQARRKRKPKAKHIPKKSEASMIDDVVDVAEGLEGGFKTTYKPGIFEEGWLLSSLRTFYDRALITDVLAQVKGGKEASVYRCAGHPSTGQDHLAAKVYRPHKFRVLRNDKMYREGRQILGTNGRPVKPDDHRLMRAVSKKSGFGLQVQHTSWLMYEFTTLQQLYDAGAAVPQPIGVGENAILMSYYGDENLPAPTLNQVQLEPDEAGQLFQEVLRNIELMLQHDLIHGDLSAYNILYWEGEITLIDFPQVTSASINNSAHFILQRDVTRICEYFSRQGVDCDPAAIMERLWIPRPDPINYEE